MLIFIIYLCSLSTGFAQANSDYLFFGSNRPFLPGLELMNSIYSINPAKAAGTVHNSISFATISLPGASNSLGLYYSLTIPNFTIVNITHTSTHYNPLQDNITDLTKDLLGLQFAIALDDFIKINSFKLACGIGLNKMRDINLVYPELSTVAIDFDFGITASFSGLDLEILVSDFSVSGGPYPGFLGPAANYAAKIGTKMILDVNFMLSLATANNYSLLDEEGTIDFIGELNFKRYFLSNSLRTGVGLEAFINADSSVNQIPVVRYNLSVSYSPFNNNALLNSDTQDNESSPIWLWGQILHNLTFNFGATMLTRSTPGHERFTPTVQIGVTKFY